MENNEEFITKANDLIASLTYYRMTVGLSYVQNEILKNKAITEKENDNMFKKGLIKVENSIKKTNISKYEEEKKKIEHCIELFKSECSEDTIYQYGDSEETMKKFIDDFLANDKDGYIRNQIALSLLIDNRFKYPHKDYATEKVSELLFDDKKQLKAIKKTLDKNLRKLLSEQKAETVSKGVLITLLVMIAATTLIGGATIVGSAMSSKNIAQSLANIGHQTALHFGAGAAIATKVIAGASIASGIFALAITNAKDIYQDEKQYKEALRSLKPSDLAADIAIRLTLIELSKDKMSKDNLKQYKESILKTVDYIRSDSEFLYIIEKAEEKDNKSKSSICNKTIDVLTSF